MKSIFLFSLFLVLCNPLKIEAQTWTGIPPGFNHQIRCLYFDTTSNYLYAGGSFSALADGTPIQGIARWNGFKWDSLGTGLTPIVFSIVAFKGDIYAGGNFPLFGTNPSPGIAKWNGNSWLPFGNMNGSPPGVIIHLNVLNDELYVLGNFKFIGNQLAYGMAKFDGQNWFTFPILDTLGYFNASIIYNNELYVGGNFDGGIGKRDIAKFDGNNWVSVGGGLSGTNTVVNDFKIFQNKLYIAGYFSSTWGDPGNSIAIWDGNSWSQASSGLLPATVDEIFEFQGFLFAAGQILSAGGTPVMYNAKWNGQSWLGTGANFDNAANCFASNNNSLFVGGAFRVLNSDTVQRIARFQLPTGGITEPNDNYITIWPNPTTATIFFDKAFCFGQPVVSIRDITGRIVNSNLKLNNEDCSMDISKLQNGIYFITIDTGTKSKHTQKLIVHK